MASEAAVERAEGSAARQGIFGRWTEGVSPNIVISVVGLILATLIGSILGGIFMMLDSQFELLHGRLDAQDRKLDEALGKVATKDDLRNIERRLLSIEEFLRGAGSSSVQRE